MILSYSGLSTFIQCPTKFKLTYIDKKRSKQTSLALELGTLCHECMEDKLGGKEGYVNKFIENFDILKQKNGYKENLSIERVNVDGSYCPENCKWITMAEQTYNKTTSVYITLDGETKGLHEWEKQSGIDARIISDRIKYGYTKKEDILYNGALRTKYKKRKEKHENENLIIFTYNNMTKNLNQWCRFLNLNYPKIHARIKKQNWTIEQALELCKKPDRLEKLESTIWVEHEGVKKCLSHWCKHLNLDFSKISARINLLGWTPKEALGFIERKSKQCKEIIEVLSNTKYNSISEAVSQLNISRDKVRKSLKNNIEVNGYKFEYLDKKE